MNPADAFRTFLDESWPPFDGASHGNGSFGRWITDGAGEPAYAYEMDQATDPRAAYRVSGGTSRDHWHLVGNDRIAATAHNGGYVQLYDWTRGPKILNRWDPGARHYAGGFRFIALDGAVFATLWDHLPEEAAQRRTFGMGYFEKATEYQDLVITERTEAPQGDDPVLVSTTFLENRRDAPVDVSVVEFWDVNLHQLTPAPIMSRGLGRFFEWRRRRLNRRFVMDAAWDPATGALRVDLAAAHPERAPGPETPAYVDYHPRSVFLAALDPLPERFNGFAADGARFFDEAGLDNPPGVRGAADAQLFARRSAYTGHAVLAFRRVVRLGPGEHTRLSYLYGYERSERIPELVARHSRPSGHRPRAALELAAPGLGWLGRELLWHSYYLEAGSFYQEFYDAHFVDQGSAYGYLHGLSGATRDFALFTLPMVYLRPALAKEMLRFSMRAQSARTGRFPYSHVGHGRLCGFVVHSMSSDLDLFFLWALSEYIAATRDLAFLQEPVAFYPPDAGRSGTVLEHAQAAFRHLTQKVGLGAHGLLRCGSGDWNDQTLVFSRCPPLTVLRGESTFNAGLATVALPALAGAIEDVDAGFAAALRAFAQGQAQALKTCWTGDWVGRGYLGYPGKMMGADRIFTDTQPFGVLGGVWDEQQAQRLFETVRTRCVDPQPAGALSMCPPVKRRLLQPGSDTNGGTWAAIDSWIAWAWSKLDPQRAWDFYLSTTLAARAEAYPETWYGVWSGPDSYNAHYHPRPAETFDVSVTPMTDFPVMNMNRHSGPLLDAIKLAGIRPRDDRIVIDPHLPFDAFAIRLPLIGAAYLPGRHRGYYAPIVDGLFRFAIRPPAALDPQRATLTVNGGTTPFDLDEDGLIRFDAPAQANQRITWEIEARNA